MTTPTIIIEKALRLIGVIPGSQSVGADLIERGREILNDLLGEWGASNIFIPYQSLLTIDLLANQEVFTIGLDDSYDLNSAAIIDLLQVNIQIPNNSNVNYPCSIITEKMYYNMITRNIVGIPSYILLRSYPDFCELHFQTIPSVDCIVLLLCKQRLEQISVIQLNQNLDKIPFNAVRALKYAIAKELFFYFPFQKPESFDKDAQIIIDSYVGSNIGVDPYVKKDEIIRGNSWAGLFRGWY